MAMKRLLLLPLLATSLDAAIFFNHYTTNADPAVIAGSLTVGQILLYKNTGYVSNYFAAEDTDWSRGLALSNAVVDAEVGETVKLGLGNYVVGELFPTNNVVIEGSGHGTLILRETNATAIINANVNTVTVRNMYLDGNTNVDYGTAGLGVLTTGIVHNALGSSIIEGCKIATFSVGIYIQGENDINARRQNSSYFNNSITNTASGIWLADNNHAEYCRIFNNSIIESFFGINNMSAANVIIMGNKISDTARALYVHPSSMRGHSVVTGNELHHATVGIYITGACNFSAGNNSILATSGAFWVEGGATNVVFHDNVLETTGGQHVDGGTGIVFRNNWTIAGSTNYMELTNSPGVIFENNYKLGTPMIPIWGQPYGEHIKTPFSTNYTVQITDKGLMCLGTNQLITLPDITNSLPVGFKVEVILGSIYSSAIVTNANGVQTIFGGLQYTVATNRQSFTSDGTNWW